MFLLSKR